MSIQCRVEFINIYKCNIIHDTRREHIIIKSCVCVCVCVQRRDWVVSGRAGGETIVKKKSKKKKNVLTKILFANSYIVILCDKI